jgi:hypothetical protein
MDKKVLEFTGSAEVVKRDQLSSHAELNELNKRESRNSNPRKLI